MLYQVDKNGKAPTNAKAGDYVVTGAGSYEILDPYEYQGMNASQLAKAGISYNPNSDLYSKKVTDSKSSFYTGKTGSYGNVKKNTSSRLNAILGNDGYTFRNYDNARGASDAYYNQVESQLQSNHDEDLATAKKAYNNNIANQEQQKEQVASDYRKNMNTLMDDAYAAQVSATQIAANRGMTSSAQGLAMNVSADMQVAKRKSELTSDRDTLINNINTEMNRIEENYGIDRATLKKKFNADKLTALSTSELQYMQACLEIDDYNANTWNNAVANKQKQDYQSAEAEKERAFQAAEAAKDRALQSSLSGGGSSGSRNSSSDETSDELSANVNKYLAFIDDGVANGKINETQKTALVAKLNLYAHGGCSLNDYYDFYKKTLGIGTTKNSDKKENTFLSKVQKNMQQAGNKLYLSKKFTNGESW